MPDLANLDVAQRVHRAIDHVHQHLAGDLRLEELARVACFSPFHFHRVFRALVGETPHAFVLRVRLERALFLLAHEPGRTLTDLAFSCGFSSSSDFSRAFRKRYGVPPSAYDVAAHREAHRERFAPLRTAENSESFEVVMRTLPARTVASLRVSDPFSPGRVPRAAERLMAWADARGLGGGTWLGYMWEEPETVALERCFYDVAVVVPESVRPDGDVRVTRFPAMTVAEVEVRGSLDLELRAFDWLYGGWLPTSGHVPDHQPAFERWHGRPYAHGEAHVELSVQLPVREAPG